MKASVVLCAHNPRADYLRRTLQSLNAQTLPKDEWELLLVDNASVPPLAPLWDLSLHPNARHIVEHELGLAAARMRGIKEAATDLLVFVDDDNVLDRSYLTRAVEIKEEWPMLGAWGSGVIVPEYELRPAEYLRPLMYSLTLRKTARSCWSNIHPCPDATPWGAGLCVRAVVADAYCRMNEETNIRISGHRGLSPSAGDDIEFAYLASKLGLGTGVFPELKLTHLISKERVRSEYILRLIECQHAANVLLAYKWETGRLPRSPFHPLGMLAVLENSISRRGIERQCYYAYVRGLLAARRTVAAHSEISGCTRNLVNSLRRAVKESSRVRTRDVLPPN